MGNEPRALWYHGSPLEAGLGNAVKIAGTFFFLLLLVQAGAAPTRLHWVDAAKRESIDWSVPLYTIDGEKTTLSEQKGKVLFINFWATWCGPCLKEMPSIAKLHEQLESQGLKGEVAVLAITDDRPDDVRSFLQKRPYPFTVLFDSSSMLVTRLEIPALPTTVVVDGRDRIALAHVGVYQWNLPDVVAQLKKLSEEGGS